MIYFFYELNIEGVAAKIINYNNGRGITTPLSRKRGAAWIVEYQGLCTAVNPKSKFQDFLFDIQ